MAPPSGADLGAPGRFVRADTPVDEVRVSIVGLTGTARAAALAAADVARGAQTLGDLDKLLRGNAVSQMNEVAMAKGGNVAVEVSPGLKRGVLDVVFRETPSPPGNWCFAVQAGFEERLDSAASVQMEHTPAASEWPPWRLRVGGLANVGNEAFMGILRLRPPPSTWLGGMPSVEIGMGMSNLFTGPQQQSLLGGFSIGDPSGRHTFRFQAINQELRDIEAPNVSESDLADPRSAKASMGYLFLSDTRFTNEGPRPGAELAPGNLCTASAELAGLFGGDVFLARCQALWTHSRRIFGGGLLSLSLAGGAALPLSREGKINPQDCFFLGGISGQGMGERMAGFDTRGVGFTDKREIRSQDRSDNPPIVNKTTLVARFDNNFGVETREAERVEEPKEQNQETLPFDRVGGAGRALLTATLQWPLTFLGLRFQGMLSGQAGSLVDEVRPTVLQDMSKQARASVSGGVAFALTGGALVGVSYAQPLLFKPGDKLKRFQFCVNFGQAL